MALTDRTAVKAYCGIATSDTSEDAFIDQVLPAVEAALKRLVGWAIEQATYTEFYDGPNQQELRLEQTPVYLAGLQVWEDPNGYYGQRASAFASTTLLTVGTDYALKLDGPGGAYSESGILVRIGRPWQGRYVRRTGRIAPEVARGQGNLKVTYTAGYASVPADIQLAVWQIVAEQRSRRQRGLLVTNESFDAYSVGLATPDADLLRIGSVGLIVAQYRRIRIG